MTRLDNRPCLYGEVRLTDAQVIALRAAAAGTLRRTPQGWFADQVGARPVSAATIANLSGRRLAIEITVTPGSRGKGTITGSGRKILAAIDEAAAS